MSQVLITLDKREREECARWASTVLSRIRGRNYTNLSFSGRYFVGRCGEVALRKWAIGLNLEFKESVNDRGRSDEQDFLFTMRDGRHCRVNVKNSHHERASYLMQPVAQHKRSIQDIYIAATGKDLQNRVEITFHGVIERHQFERMAKIRERYVLTYEIPLAQLPYSLDDFARRVRVRDSATGKGTGKATG